MADHDPYAEILYKIDREKALINGAVNMRAGSNPYVQAAVDSQIKEARKNITFLEQKLQELRMRNAESSMGDMNLGSDGRNGPSGGRNNAFSPQNGPGYGSPSSGQDYSDQLGAGSGAMPSRPPYGPQAPGSTMPKSRPNYSKLDLIKADTPYLGPRFQLMLSQLTFKLSVEKQYKDGIEKMIKLYSDEGDRKSRSDAQSRLVESNQKIQLLRQALKRYEDLHVDMDSPDIQDDDSINSPQLRKPLSGHLMMRVQAVKEVNHAATSRFSRGPETVVVVKVEDAFKARTKTTRTDKWSEELHSIEIDKANEIELTVYDKNSNAQWPTPIGMLWIRVSDIMEEMRRKKVEAELSGSQWMTADQIDRTPGSRSGTSGPGGFAGNFNPNLPPSASGRPEVPRPPGGAGGEGSDPNVVDAWFALEPVGAIHLALSFTKENRGKAGFDAGLGRKGAVRQRKEEVQEKNGHKFVKQQFYTILRCALCGQFLKNAAGMQCEDCKFTCHAECFSKVVTKCISKSNAETDPDEEKISHRIPHRFEPFSNLSANWCCHCGYMLPFGKKNSRKCSECALTVHGSCQHLVPDFCGMSMARANEILIQLLKIRSQPPPVAQGRPTQLQKTLRNDPSSRPPIANTESYEGQMPYETRPQPEPRRSYNDYEQSQSFDQAPIQSLHGMDLQMKAAQQANKPTSPTRPYLPTTPSAGPESRSVAATAANAALAKSYAGQTGSDYGSRQGARTSGGYGTSELPTESSPQKGSSQQSGIPNYNPGAYASWQNPQQPTVQPYPQQPIKQPFPEAQKPPQQQQPPQAIVKPQAPTKDPLQGSQRRIGLEHFNFLAVLGKGNFGKVMLAETKATKKLYAIKVLKKEFIIENDEVESTKSEKRVFLIANKERHPFLLNLHACFQTETRVYFVMEYISGGDLMLHIQRGQFGLKRAQFYAAEVCLALKYFHENGVIYRDLKLDNIMLTMDGHIKVADYGLCKEEMWYGSTTSTFCGTPEFMAPEILLDKKYGRAVDWWAFGVLIYQMLLQQSPFRGEDEDEIYDAILSDEPLYPIHMPRDSVSILQKLLTREPELRLGSGPTDAQEIMSHAFFRNINWDEFREKRVPPPFIPSIKSPTDTSNFDSEFTSVTPVLTPVQSVLTQAMQEEFRGFSYCADFI